MNGSDNKNNRKRSIPALLRRYYDLLWYSFNPVVFFRVFDLAMAATLALCTLILLCIEYFKAACVCGIISIFLLACGCAMNQSE